MSRKDDPYWPDRLQGDARKKCILDNISDLFADLLYYDRKEDENLPRGSIEEAIEQGEITKDEIIIAFHHQIEKNFT